MAIPACPKCERDLFELKTNTSVAGSTFAISMVQCRICGTVVGTLEANNNAAMLFQIADAVKTVGYQSAVIVGGSHKKIRDAYHLPRIGIGSMETFSFFKCQTTGLISIKNKFAHFLERTADT